LFEALHQNDSILILSMKIIVATLAYDNRIFFGSRAAIGVTFYMMRSRPFHRRRLAALAAIAALIL